MSIAIGRTAAPGGKVQVRHLFLALGGAVAVAIGIAIGATAFDSEVKVDAAASRAATLQTILERPSAPIPDLTVYLVKSEDAQNQLYRNVYEGEQSALQSGYSGPFGRSLVLVAGTAEEDAQAARTLSESIAGFTNLAVSVSVVDLRK